MATTKARKTRRALFVILLSGLTVLFFLGFRGTQDPRQVANALGIQIPTEAEAMTGSIQGFQSHRYTLEFRLPSSALPSFLTKLGARTQDKTRFEGSSPLLRGIKRNSDTQVLDWETRKIRAKVLVDPLDSRRTQVRIVASD